MDIRATISKPIGPLPLWGWVFVGIAGYVIYRFVLKGSSATAADTSSNSNTSGDNGEGGSGNSYGDPIIQVDLAGSNINAPSTSSGNVISSPTVGGGTTATTSTPTNPFGNIGSYSGGIISGTQPSGAPIFTGSGFGGGSRL